MPRPIRFDYPGAFHHVLNRGVAQRPIAGSSREIRYLLSRLARVVRAGLIEVHAYVVMDNHFHFLVRSPKGEIAHAMREVQDRYAQRFNWRRDRCGPVFQGRYKSRLIESAVYWENVVRYIDRNPVRAGIVNHAASYPWGSARAYVAGAGPCWLTRGLVEDALRSRANYVGHFIEAGNELSDDLVERRARCPLPGDDPIDRLLAGGAPLAREWLLTRARTGPKETAGLLVPPGALLRRMPSVDQWTRDDRTILAGLLRVAVGLSLEEIGAAVGVSRETARRHEKLYRERLLAEVEFAGRAADLLADGIRTVQPPPIVKLGPYPDCTGGHAAM